MMKFIPILVVGILILCGFGAVAFNNTISKDIKQSSLFDELDQSQTVMTENGAFPVGNIPIPDNSIYIQVAQSFIPTKEVLTRVELFIGKNSTATYPLTISIKEELTGDDLTVIDIDPSQVPTETYDWVEIDFENITVTIDMTYYIVALTVNITDNYYAWGANNISESYPDGCAWVSVDEGDTWTNESSSSSYPNTAITNSFQGSQPIFEDVATWDMCFKTYGIENAPPNAPSIDGKTSGKTGKVYEYTFNAIDPNGDNIKYYIDWGDNNTKLTVFHASNTDAKYKHSWSEKGTYNITAKAIDVYGAEGPETTLEVSMPKSFDFKFILESWLFERFQNAFPFLRQIL